MDVLFLLRWILFYLRSFYKTVHSDEGHRLGIFSDILIILSTFIRSSFELFISQQVIQNDRMLSITDL